MNTDSEKEMPFASFLGRHCYAARAAVATLKPGIHVIPGLGRAPLARLFLASLPNACPTLPLEKLFWTAVVRRGKVVAGWGGHGRTDIPLPYLRFCPQDRQFPCAAFRNSRQLPWLRHPHPGFRGRARRNAAFRRTGPGSHGPANCAQGGTLRCARSISKGANRRKTK
jgi:hypothetical protein